MNKNHLLDKEPANFVSIKERIEELGSFEKFIKVELPIINKLAKFMNFEIYPIENQSIPLYSRITKEELVKTDIYLQLIKKGYSKEEAHNLALYDYVILNWIPTLNYNQAHLCEQELFKRGGYKNKNLDYTEFEGNCNGRGFNLDYVTLIYSGSLFNQDLVIIGKDELGAICNACIKFMGDLDWTDIVL